MLHICLRESRPCSVTSRGRTTRLFTPYSELMPTASQSRSTHVECNIPHPCPCKRCLWRLPQPPLSHQHVTWEVWWESAGRLQKDRQQISGSNAKLPSYRRFRCLFGGRWYLMAAYRGPTELAHKPCYHTGPFPGAPTGRVGSQGTAEKGTPLPFGKERKKTPDTFNKEAI